MALEFQMGDILAMIGTDIRARVVCASSGWRCYYLDYHDTGANGGWEGVADEVSSKLVEREYVLIEREGWNG